MRLVDRGYDGLGGIRHSIRRLLRWAVGEIYYYGLVVGALGRHDGVIEEVRMPCHDFRS